MKKIQNKQLIKAITNFEDICNCRNFKFKYLDDWLYTKSTLFKNEVNSNKSRKFKVYPRGAIVYVRLGVNIGSELSGNHFCIVLNKKDHRRNELITVVPLTSKDTKFSIKLEESLVLKAVEKMKSDSSLLREDLNKIKDLYNTSLETENSQSTFERELSNLEINYKELIQIIDRYQRFASKWTYAIPSQLVTISKHRITTINKYDPTGHISFSENTLKVIEDFIKVNILA